MSDKIKELNINGNKYRITLFMGSDALKMSLRLAKIVSPILLSMGGMMAGKKDGQESLLDKEVTEETMKALITAFQSSFDVPEVYSVVIDLLDAALIESENLKSVKSCLETHLKGNLGVVFPICEEVIKHNNFLDLFAPVMGKFGASMSKFQTT